MLNNEEHNKILRERLAIDLNYLDKDEKYYKFIPRLYREFKQTIFMFPIFFKLSLIQAKSHKLMYFISFFSVFLVVFMCILLISMLLNLPIIFLLLGELNRGQNDLIILPGGDLEGAISLNYSFIENIFPSTDLSRSYHSPRITWTTEIVNLKTCNNIQNKSNLWFEKYEKQCFKNCLHMHCNISSTTRQQLIAIDVERENRMGFGLFKKNLKIKKGEVILSKNTALILDNTKINDTVLLYADVSLPFREAFLHFPSFKKKQQKTEGGRKEEEGIYTIMRMKVKDIINPDRLKFDRDDFILINYNSVLSDVTEGLSPHVDNLEKLKLKYFNPKYCANSIHFNLNPKERQNIYKSGDYTTIRQYITLWTMSIVNPLGINQISIITPIVYFLYTVRYFSLFVKLIVSIILLSLTFLSYLLLYSLLNLTIETNIYELGIKRMIGFSKWHLCLMLFINTYIFSLPAWIFGLIFGQLFYLILRFILRNSFNIQLSYFVPLEAYGWATFIGILLPLISLIFPTYALISQKLPDSLNISYGRNVGVVYKIIKEKDYKSINYLMLTLGFLLSTCGFMLYYFLPLALSRMQLELLFYIFFSILIGMLIGYIILILNFEYIFQFFISYIFLFWEKIAIFQIFQKCLISHRKRNRKITLIYAFSLGFIIFISIAFQIQLKSFYYEIKRDLGAEIIIHSDFMDFSSLSDFSVYVRNSLPEVSGFTYLSKPTVFFPPIHNVTILSLGRYKQAKITGLCGIPPNYFNILHNKFLGVELYDKNSQKYSIAGSLYTEERNKVIISSTIYSLIKSKSLEDPILLSTTLVRNLINKSVKTLRFAVKPSAVLYTSPQVFMSNFRGQYGNVLVSLSNLVRYTGIDYLSIRSIPFSTISLRVLNSKNIYEVSQKVKSYLMRNKIEGISVRDITTNVDYLNIADNVLGFFFIFTQILTLIVCFFSLLGNMTANILNSTKEIGIYRCLGMTKLQIYRIFIWEALIVVSVAGFLGLFVGIMIGYTMYIQNYLFTQLPISFSFPYVELLITVVMALVAAILSSYGPVAALMQLTSITQILRQVY